MFKLKYHIFIVFILLFGFATQAQNTSSTKGKLFWCGYMESIGVNKLKLYITYSDKTKSALKKTSVEVSVPGQLWTRSYTITNHSFEEIDIPEIHAYINTDDYEDNRAVKVVSTEDIEVRIAIMANKSMDATTVMPYSKIEKAPTTSLSACLAHQQTGRLTMK